MGRRVSGDSLLPKAQPTLLPPCAAWSSEPPNTVSPTTCTSRGEGGACSTTTALDGLRMRARRRASLHATHGVSQWPGNARRACMPSHLAASWLQSSRTQRWSCSLRAVGADSSPAEAGLAALGRMAMQAAEHRRAKAASREIGSPAAWSRRTQSSSRVGPATWGDDVILDAPACSPQSTAGWRWCTWTCTCALRLFVALTIVLTWQGGNELSLFPFLVDRPPGCALGERPRWDRAVAW